MWKRVKDNLESGTEKVRWFSSLMNERVKIEISLVKLLYQTSELEKKRAGLMQSIGERIFELKNSGERNILREPEIMDAINKIEELDAEIEENKNKVSELGRIEA